MDKLTYTDFTYTLDLSGDRPDKPPKGGRDKNKPAKERVQRESRIINKLNLREVRDDLVLSYGGKCERCGYAEFSSALNFHHLDPTTKEATVSTFIGSYCNNPSIEKWERVITEANKCILLCANCHTSLHAKQWTR